jgi:hypothetical protein
MFGLLAANVFLVYENHSLLRTISTQREAVDAAKKYLDACHCGYDHKASIPAPESKPERFTIIRIPADAPCPDGYTRRKDAFVEKDGSRQDACIYASAKPGHFTLDVLHGGETLNLNFELMGPQQPEDPTPRRAS